MNPTILIALCTCVFLFGCSTYTQPQKVVVSNSKEQKISFGIYDIAGSGPSFSSLFSTRVEEPLFQKGVSVDRNTLDESAPATSSADVSKATIHQTAPIGSADGSRKVIKNAEMRVESDDPDELQRVITSIAETNGGFVVSLDQSMSDISVNMRDSILIAIRVPADRFNIAVESIRAASARFLVEAIKGDDVTEEFVDIEARLRAKRSLETQFMEIMKRAETVDEALLVQRELAEVRSEIEKIEGRSRYLKDQAALSTIRVHIQTPSSIAANSAGAMSRLGDSLERGVDFAFSSVLGLVTFVVSALPLAVVFGVPGFLIVRSVWFKKDDKLDIVDKSDL